MFYNMFYCSKFSGTEKFPLRGAAPGDIVFSFQKKMSSQQRNVSRVTPLPLRKLKGRLWSEVNVAIPGEDGSDEQVPCLKVSKDGVVVRKDDFLLLTELFQEHWNDITSPATKGRRVAGDLLSFAIRMIWPGQSFTSICQPYGYEQRAFSEFNSRRESAFLGKYHPTLLNQINVLLLTVKKLEVPYNVH